MDRLLFADYAAQVADSEEKVCRLMSEFGRVCERRKLSKSKVMRCSRYGHGDRMHAILNGEPLEYRMMPHNIGVTATRLQ